MKHQLKKTHFETRPTCRIWFSTLAGFKTDACNALIGLMQSMYWLGWYCFNEFYVFRGIQSTKHLFRLFFVETKELFSSGLFPCQNVRHGCGEQTLSAVILVSHAKVLNLLCVSTVKICMKVGSRSAHDYRISERLMTIFLTSRRWFKFVAVDQILGHTLFKDSNLCRLSVCYKSYLFDIIHTSFGYPGIQRVYLGAN